jgi:MoaA/NifB/PqqE/SkfB family radical SAM enzyme
LHPSLPRLVRLALSLGISAEIYSNLVRMTADLWELCERPEVSLATSWYSSDRLEHKAITGRDTWRQTRANIVEAVSRGIPVRAGVVSGIIPGQRSEDAERELRALGVGHVSADHLREFGRGTIPDPSQACGSCGRGRAAVLPDGTVTPCPMTRWLATGNVHTAELDAILALVPEAQPGCPRARTGHRTGGLR